MRERPTALCPPVSLSSRVREDPASLGCAPGGVHGGWRAEIRSDRGSQASARVLGGPAAEAGPGVVVGGRSLCLRPGAGSATRIPGGRRAHLPGVGVLCLGRGAASGACTACLYRGCPAGRVLANKALGDRHHRDYAPRTSLHRYPEPVVRGPPTCTLAWSDPFLPPPNQLNARIGEGCDCWLPWVTCQ